MRPRIRVPYRWWDYLVLGAGAALVVAEVLETVLSWPHLPPRVPTHFGLTGAPNQWGSRSNLLVLPILTTVIYIGSVLLSRIPQYFNYPGPVTADNAVALYTLGRLFMEVLVGLEVPLVFLALQRAMIAVAQGTQHGVGGGVLLGIALTTITLVAFLILLIRAGKAR